MMFADMKFIERLFGKKQEKEESNPVVFNLKDISATVKAETKEQEDELKPVVKERYDSIIQALNDLDILKKELIAARPIENVSKRGEKLGDSNRDNVVNNLKLIRDKLSIPGSTSPVAASEFYLEAKSTLKTVLDNTNRSLLYIKALYPQEHQKITQGLAELEDTIDELYSSTIKGNQRITELQSISTEADNVQRIQEEIENSQNKILELENKCNTAKEKLASDESGLVGLESSSEFERAKMIESDIRNLNTKIADNSAEARRLFTPLSKAISRMEKQDENQRCVLSPGNRETLHAIKDDPSQAIERDLSAFLAELTTRIESGELGLKDQMSDKALKQIQVLSDGKVVASLVEHRKEALSEKEKLTAELNSLSIYQEKEAIEKKIEAHKDELSSANHDIDSERKHMENLKEEIERAKTSLLSGVRNVFGSDSEIIYDSSSGLL